MTGGALLLTGAEIAETLRAHERGQSHGPASGGLTLPGGSLHAKMAAIHDAGRLFVVVKSNVNLPGNPERIGRPTIQGVLLLFDGDTGDQLASMDSIDERSRSPDAASKAKRSSVRFRWFVT